MSTSAPRAVKSRGRDSDDEEDDGKITAEEESEINRIMGRGQQPQQKKGALSLAERAQQRVLMASGLPAASKNMLQDILSSEAPRASAAMASLPRTSARSSPVDEEARKRQEAERKAREELREQLRKEEEELEKEEDSEDDEEGHDKKKKEKKRKTALYPQKTGSSDFTRKEGETTNSSNNRETTSGICPWRTRIWQKYTM